MIDLEDNNINCEDLKFVSKMIILLKIIICFLYLF